MKVLFLSPWFPYPPVNGSKIRIYNLIKSLSRQHEVRLISFVRDGEQVDPKGLEGICELEATIPWCEFAPNSYKSLLGFFSPTPRSIIDTYCPEMAKQIQRSLAQEQPDLIIASQIHTAIYASPKWGIPCVYEEVELGIYSDIGSISKSSKTKLRNQLSWTKVHEYTRRLMKRFDACTVVSDQERELLVRVLKRDGCVHVVPNGVDLDFNQPGITKPQPNTLIFNGAITYSANYDAVSYFLKDIFPMIRQQAPETTFKVTGMTKGVNLSQLHLDEHVELTGFLPDIRPAVARAWACVVPLRHGGGTRLKILEAMALGTPVVATPKAIEGLDVIPEIHFLMAEDGVRFAQQVIRLLNNHGLRSQLAQSGRRLVEERYGWNSIGHQFTQIAESLVSN